MKLSERIPHDQRCPVAKYKSGECTCYVSEVAQIEEDNEALKEIEAYSLELCAALPSGAYPDDSAGELCELLAETITALARIRKETPCP